MSDAAVRELITRAEERERAGDPAGAARLYRSAHMACTPGPLRDELAAIIQSIDPETAPPPPPPRKPLRLPWPAIGGGVVLLVLVAAWTLWPSGSSLGKRIAEIVSAGDRASIDLTDGQTPSRSRAFVFWSPSKGVMIDAQGLPASIRYDLWALRPEGPVRVGALPDARTGGRVAVFDAPGSGVPEGLEVRTRNREGAGTVALSSAAPAPPALYAADFATSPQGWQDARGEGFTTAHRGGRYRIGISGRDVYVYSRAPGAAAVANARATANLEFRGDGLAGVIARFSESTADADHLVHADHPTRPHSRRTSKRMYFCWIAQGRTFGCYKIVDYTWTPVLEPRTSPAIQAGANRLTVEANGSAFKVIINGTEVAQFVESSLTDGAWGLCAYSQPGQFEASFGEFRLTK